MWVDAHGNSHGVSSWTGNVLLALARLDKGDAFRRLYSEPWGKAQLEAPHITDVDDLTTNVSQAFYDAKKRALIVTVKPGPIKVARTSFVVRNLDPGGKYRLFKDGSALDELRAGADGTVAVSTSLEQPHSFVLVAAK